MRRGNKRRKKGARDIACITLIALLIAPLIVFGATQNVTEQNITLPIPENVTLFKNLTELNETQPQPENITDITAPIITILSPENTTYNTTAICLNYTIDEPTDWVGYSLNGASNVTIFMDNTTFNAVVGLNNLIVYARDTAGNIGKAEVQFTVDINVTTENITDVPEYLNITITPKLKLIKTKGHFRADEEPEFIFKFEFEHTGEEKAFGIAAAAAENETIETFVYDSSGKLTDIEPEIEKIRAGKFSIKLPKERAFRAGLYKLSVELVQDEQVFVVEKEFPWGLVSLNTRKSIYKPGETAEFVIVVLDKDGHPVSGADISMTVTNPNNEKTVYRTDDGTILPGEECGLYNADYLTEVEGNHTIDIIALISGIEVNFSTHFLVKQDYAFDIIRTAQSKIDPTRQAKFDVKIDIESFTDADFVTIKEFVPAEFDVFSTDADTVLLEGDTKTIAWTTDLTGGKTSVSYSYAVPHIWPYLYALGPAEINYDGKTFMEARPWYVAVDPSTITQYATRYTETPVLDTTTAQGVSALHYADWVTDENAVDTTNNLDKGGTWIVIADYDNETIPTGSSIDVVNVTFVWDTDDALTDEAGSWAKLYIGDNETGTPVWYLLEEWNNTNGAPSAYTTYYYTTLANGTPIKDIINTPAKASNMAMNFTAYESASGDQNVDVLLDQLIINVTYADTTEPTITIDEPRTSSPVYKKGGEQFYVNFTYTEENPKNYTVKIYNSTDEINSSSDVYPAGGENKVLNKSFNLNSTAADGYYNVSVEMYDNASNYNISYQNNSVVKDTTGPTVTIINPKNKTYNTVSLTLNSSAGADAKSCWYSLNGGTNASFTCGEAVGITANEGSNNISVYANDTLENIGSDIVLFSVNTSIILDISITSPANGTITNDPTPTLTLLAIDKDYPTIDYTLYIYNETGALYSVGNSGTLNNNTPTQIVLSPAITLIGESTTYKIIAAANDSAPNSANSSDLYIIIQPPVVYLISPEYGYWDNDGDINFTFKYDSTSFPTANCSLYINSIYNQSNASTIDETETAFNVTGIAEGKNQNWTINCTMNGISVEDTSIFHVDKIVPTVTIDEPTETSPVHRKGGELFYVNFTYTEDNPKNYTVEIGNSTAVVNSSLNESVVGGTDQIANVSFYLNSSAANGKYNITVKMYDKASNSNISYQNYSVVKWGWSNVTWGSPPDGSGYTVGDTITLTCLVRDANSSSPIENYPVHFYNRTDSTVTYDFGVNYTNSSGYAVMDWDTTGGAAGWYYPKGNITDNATLYYNVSASYEVNTSIKLYSTTLEIKNQTNVTAINFINFSGASGDTAKDPYNDVDGSGSPQNTSTTTPVVTIYNPSSSTNYKIWLKATAGTGWSAIIIDEKFNVTVHSVSPGDVSTWATLTEWGSYKDSGVTVDHGTYKDLYLAFELKGSGTGSSTLSVLGETV